MNASVKGALAQINKSYYAFTHRGKRMTKSQVEAVLKYADQVGYETTDQIKDSEVDEILDKLKKRGF